LAWFSINFVIEFIAFAVITPPIVFALKKAHLVSDGKKINKKEILESIEDVEKVEDAKTQDIEINTQGE